MRQLLTAQEKLNPFLFDSNAAMHEELRQILLNKCYFIYNLATQNIPGLEIEDIRLAGSMTSYFYRANSDIDVKIMIKNSGNPFLPKNGRFLGEALNLLHTSLGNDKIRLFLNGKFVDVQFDCICMDAGGLYSILENKWLIKPNKNRFKGITPEELLANFYEAMDEINTYMKQFKLVNGKFAIEDCKKMLEYYHYQVVDKTSNKNNKMNYLVFKMLNSQRILKRLGSYAVECLSISLSELENEESNA